MKDQDLIGGVAIIEKGRAHLLIRQAKDKPYAGMWRHPGGKFEDGENPRDGIPREVLEETGLEVSLLKETPLLVLPGDYKIRDFGFFVCRLEGGSLTIDKKEADDAGWFDMKEILNLDLMPATRKFYQMLNSGSIKSL
jgi:8-oxo-dGTP diphosphatase